jgi:hypothetical protein
MAKRTKAPVTSRTQATQDDIARRAYELYTARGGQAGADVEDWLRAERELREPRNGADNEAA